MKTIFTLTEQEDELFQIVAESAAIIDVEAYAVGGWVRDKFLKRKSKDIDITCIGDGIRLAEVVKSKLGDACSFAFFKNFGTAQLKYKDFEIEFVGCRKESYQPESRNPVVVEGTLLDDLSRRDFTINAIAFSLSKNNFGSIIDYFNGIDHIAQGILTTPLDPVITFQDDPLRMMRAVRFHAQLQFQIDTTTAVAITQSALRLSIISQERITEEINKILLSERPSFGFLKLFDLKMLPLIFPALHALHGVERRGAFAHKDNFYHTLEVLDNVAKQSNDLWLRWAALLHDIAKPPTKRFEEGTGWTFHGHEVVGAKWVKKIFIQFKLPLNDKLKKVEKLVLLHLRPIALTKEAITDAAVRRLLFDAGDDIDDLMILCNADITSKNEAKVKRYLHNFELVKLKLVEVEERDRVRNFQPCIDGLTIMQMFDLKPTRTVGILKNSLKDAILDGFIKNEVAEAKLFLLNQYEKINFEK